MAVIHQALFGYSNGHHLISSSLSFDGKTLKKLETLSDLTGTTISSNFDGYLTGYSLADKEIYVISKTWYAQEMPRPGCVWTHALLIPYDIPASDLKKLEFNKAFRRPELELSDYAKVYTTPIQIESENDLSICNLDNSLENGFYDCLSLIIENSEPIIITANECNYYNNVFEEIVKNMGISFIKDISFCTGSFSLRTIGEKIFSIQIAPPNIPKSKLRGNSQSKLIIATNQACFGSNLAYSKVDFNDAINFLHNFEEMGLNKIKLKFVLDLLSGFNNEKYISLQRIIDNTTSIFNSNYILSEVLYQIFQHELINKKFNCQIFKEFCTFIYENKCCIKKITNDVIYSAIDNLFKKRVTDVPLIFKQLIENELNEIGETSVCAIANRIDNNFLDSFINEYNYNSLLALLSLNLKLSLNDNIWKLPMDVQCEIIKIIAGSYPINHNQDSTFYESVILTIYNNSKFDLSNRIYESFKELAIDTFFKWAQMNGSNAKLSPWLYVCKYNSIASIMKLKECNVSENIFKQIIEILDPYKNDMVNVPIDVWLYFYEKYCLNTNDNTTQNIYAQFLLPVVLRSNSVFPNILMEFAFSTVHLLLARDKMDYFKWEKLSALLPEVSWYNMWDKCKRLRKAAKNKNLTIDLKKYK